VTVLALTTALTALTACGGGSGSGSTTTDTAGDNATAQKIVLKQTDLPSGWTSKTHQTSPDDATTRKRFFECIGGTDPKPQQSADVHSPDFTQGQLNQASSEVQLMKTAKDASDAMAALQGAKTVDCVKQLGQEAAQTQLPAGTSITDLTAAQLKFPTLKDGTAAVRVSFTVATSGGVNVPIYADVVYFRAGRALASLSTVSGGAPMDAKLEEGLAQKMASRA
jgi:hypothetical protein